MRTHKIVFTCSSPECAKKYDENVLQVDFCDLTHWFCGLDGAGEDTPETCIIYRGYIHPERITVELDFRPICQTEEQFVEWVNKRYRPHLICGDDRIIDVKASRVE